MRLVILLAVIASSLSAFSCIERLDPCARIRTSDSIFVAEVRVGSDQGKGNAQVNVIEALQNMPPGLKKTTIRTPFGTTIDRPLQAGKQYVIITSGPHYSTHLCDSSFELDGNQHILAALRDQIRDSKPQLVGRVANRTANGQGPSSVPNAEVTVLHGSQRLSTATNSSGHFSFRNLDPGIYHLLLDKPGYHPSETPTPSSGISVKVQPASCTILDLEMTANGRIGGTIRNRDGVPLADIPVQFFARDQKGPHSKFPILSTATAADGTFDAHPLPRGTYDIGVNANPNADESPFRPTLRASGRQIALGESQSIGAVHITLPPPRTPAKLRVKVFLANGEPVALALLTLLSHDGKQRWSSLIEANEEGAFLVPAYVGERYQVLAQVLHSNGVFEGRAVSTATAQINEVTVKVFAAH